MSSFNLGSTSLERTQVIDRTHPPVIRPMAAAADQGELAKGLVVANDATNGIEAFARDLTKTVGTGNGTLTTFSATLDHFPVMPGSVTVTIGEDTIEDDGHGGLGSGTVDYSTGEVTVTVEAAPAAGVEVIATYANLPVGVLVEPCDTDNGDLAARVLVHGTVVKASLLVGATAVDEDDLEALAAFGIWGV